MNVTFWFLIAFGGANAPVDIVDRFTTEFHCENVRRQVPDVQRSQVKCVQATVAR